VAQSQWSFKTVVETSAALAVKQVSAVELAQDAIGRIERHDAKINAICVRDFDRALAAARAADAALAHGEQKPLLGIPMTVKESYNIAGRLVRRIVGRAHSRLRRALVSLRHR
jgi:amidase